MKKSVVFIMVLLVIFSCLMTKLDDDLHVISSKNYNTSVTKIKSNRGKISYTFSADTDPIDEELKVQADKISAKYSSEGIQIAVMKNRQLIYTYEYGYSDVEAKKPLTSDSIYRVASLAKFVTDSVFMKLYDLGKVELDADISDYLGFKVRNPYFPDTVITPEMLMSHCGTVVDSTAFDYSIMNNSSYTIKEIIESPGTLCQAEPGKFYYYSNFSNALIGSICELVTGRPFNELAKEYFFEPLGIDASYLASELKNTSLVANIYGSGGITAASQLSATANSKIGQTHHLTQGNLLCSAKDYLKFVAMISANGVTETGERLLSNKSVKEMMKPRIYDGFLGSGFGCEKNENIIKGRTLYSHTGNAYGMHSIYAFDPKTGDGIVILTSGADAQYLDDVGIYDICLEYVNLMFPKS